MKKRKFPNAVAPCTELHSKKSVLSTTSPYFDSDQMKSNKADNSGKAIRRSSRLSLAQSSSISQSTNQLKVENSAKLAHNPNVPNLKSSSTTVEKKKKSDGSCVGKKRNRFRKTMSHKQSFKSSEDDSDEWFASSTDLESEETDSSYQPDERKASKLSGRVKQRNRKPNRKKTEKQPVEKKRMSTGTTSPARVVEGSDTDSSNAFRPVEAAKIRESNKRKGKSLLVSEFTGKLESGHVSPDRTRDNSDDDDWEEVHDQIGGEVEFMNALFQARSKVLSEDVSDSHPDTSITVAVPANSSLSKRSNKDPKLAEAQARTRQLKELFLSMHLTHVMCFLACTRFLNRICDSAVCRALGLSLLGNVSSIRRKGNRMLELAKWTLDNLADCLIPFLTYQQDEPRSDNTESPSIHQRIIRGVCTSTDRMLLFVSALRALNFDVRLIVALTPLPLKPAEVDGMILKIEKCSPETAEVERTKKVTPKANRKIISSDDDSDFQPALGKRPQKPSTRVPQSPGFYVFAEVFLPSLNRWVCIDFSEPSGSVDKLPRYPSMFYVLGATTTRSTSPNTQPYVGRNPVDLASRYDPHWCIRSRTHRLPTDRWSRMLNFQRSFFDLDAAYTSSLLARTDSSITVQRDQMDEDVIRSELLNQPLPDKMQDFKNHPLYVLQRHLLKFEVIHPPDAIPLGFFRGEPVFSRDCLHLCHTRESWLKEAKMVRLHEKPAKVVKARLSMKRKLLQGSDPTPPMVEVFGSWQVEDYQPPVAENGIVPRNAHGTIDLFKPCMLPIGCAHICLTGIQHIAKKLNIDCAPAVTGWKFHGAGWAIPIVHGYVVCKEAVPALIDAWRATRMNAAKAAAEERSERALDNWRRLVRGLFLWHRVKAQFALAPLHPAIGDQLEKPVARSKPVKKRQSKSIEVKTAQTSVLNPVEVEPDQVGSLVVNNPISDVCGWQRLGAGELAHTLPIFPVVGKPKLESMKPRKRRKNEQNPNPTSQKSRAGRGRQSGGRGKRKKPVTPSSTEESESEPTPDTSDTESDTVPDEEDSEN